MTGRFARPRATIHAVTRPLTARERDILDLLLSIDLPGAGELREQAMSVSAEREGMVIDLIVNEGLPSATVVSRTPVQLPSTATATTVAYSSCGRRSAVRPGVTHLVSSLGMMGAEGPDSILVFPAAPVRRVHAI
jgi:hypothetical protein